MKHLSDAPLLALPKILDKPGNTCERQTLQLITKIRELRTKKFYNIGPRLTALFDATSLSMQTLNEKGGRIRDSNVSTTAGAFAKLARFIPLKYFQQKSKTM